MTEELPAGWSIATLGSLLAAPLANGRSVPTEDGGFPVLRLTAITGAALDLSARKGGAWTEREASSFLVAQGDFLVARGNGSLHLVGRGALLRDEPDPVAFPDTMVRVRVDRQRMDPEFLALLWLSRHVRAQIEAKARTTAGIYKINQQTLENLRLPVPPLSEQRRIVTVLDEQLTRLDEALARTHQALIRVDALHRSVVEHIVWPDLLPSGWQIGTLGDLLDDISAGKSYACLPRPAGSDEWGIIKVSAMTWGEFRPDENKAVPDEATVDARFEIKPGDVLVSRANTQEYVGAPVLVKECRAKLLLSDKSLRLTPRASVDRAWLARVLSSPSVRGQISDRATGTKDSMRNISQLTLAEVPVPIAPLEDQAVCLDKINQQLAYADRLRTQVRHAADTAIALRRSLLSAAFTGRLVPQDPNDEPAISKFKPIPAPALRSVSIPAGIQEELPL